jgi:CHASE3 domain sensor protein
MIIIVQGDIARHSTPLILCRSCQSKNLLMTKKSRAAFLIVLLLLLAGLVGIAYAHIIQQEANDRYKNEIEALEEALKATDLSIEDRQSIELSL